MGYGRFCHLILKIKYMKTKIKIITIILSTGLLTSSAFTVASSTAKSANANYTFFEQRGELTDWDPATSASTTAQITAYNTRPKIVNFEAKFGRRLSNGYAVSFSWDTTNTNYCDLYSVKDTTTAKMSRNLVAGKLKTDGKFTTNYNDTKTGRGKSQSVFQLECSSTVKKAVVTKTVSFDMESKSVQDY